MLMKMDAYDWARECSTYEHALIWDPRDEEWALWRLHSIAGEACAVVGWNGVVIDLPSAYGGAFEVAHPTRFAAYPLPRVHLDGLVMAARHLPDEQAWYALCERTVNRLSTSVRQESTHADR